MATQKFDLIVLGAGPGGYVAAIRAAQLGMTVACVEKRGALGGTCLNVGCIPSKALLQSSHLFAEAKTHFADHGIGFSGVKLDLAAMMARKDKVVTGLTQGIEFLFKKNKVTYVRGHAAFLGKNEIAVTEGPDAGMTLAGERILIATGSEVMNLPGITIDEKKILSSTGALALSKVPGHLIVIGAGYIGLEMGSVWQRLGSQVTVLEYLDRIVPGMDAEVAKQFQRSLTKQGLAFRLGVKVLSATVGRSHIAVELTPAAGGDKEVLQADAVLVAVGRKPNTAGLGLDAAGVSLDERGRIAIDDHFRTNIPHIYAIGDVVKGPMLAHKAEEEGIAAAEIMAGQAGHVNYETVPGVVYTWPEVATVGRTEEELKAAGIAYRAGKFPFSANSRARANGENEGFVKILSDATSDRVLGVHIMGPEAGTLIHECIMAMEFGGSSEDIARAFHAHPTLNEAVKEAALALNSGAIHI